MHPERHRISAEIQRRQRSERYRTAEIKNQRDEQRQQKRDHQQPHQKATLRCKMFHLIN